MDFSLCHLYFQLVKLYRQCIHLIKESVQKARLLVKTRSTFGWLLWWYLTWHAGYQSKPIYCSLLLDIASTTLSLTGSLSWFYHSTLGSTHCFTHLKWSYQQKKSLTLTLIQPRSKVDLKEDTLLGNHMFGFDLILERFGRADGTMQRVCKE